MYTDKDCAEKNFEQNNKKMQELAIAELGYWKKEFELDLVNAVKKCDLLRVAELIDSGISLNLQENIQSLMAIAIQNEDELMVRMLKKTTTSRRIGSR